MLEESRMALALRVMENTQISSAGFVFTQTHTHRMRNWCCVTYEFLFVHRSRTKTMAPDVSVIKTTFDNPPLAFCLCLCFSSSGALVEARRWGTPAMAHSPPPKGTGSQVPLPSSSSSSSHPALPHPACRRERREAPSGHHRPALWSKRATQGELSIYHFTVALEMK